MRTRHHLFLAHRKKARAGRLSGTADAVVVAPNRLAARFVSWCTDASRVRLMIIYSAINQVPSPCFSREYGIKGRGRGDGSGSRGREGGREKCVCGGGRGEGNGKGEAGPG